MSTLAPSYFPGSALPAGTYRVAAVRHTSHARVLLIWFSAIAVVALALVGVTMMMSKPSVRYMCPPSCGRPPTGTPVATNPRFTAADGAFSVSYPAEGSAYTITKRPDGITAQLHAGDGGMLELIGEPAANRSPEQIAKSLISRTFPDARTAYKIPNAMVGYQPGYGEAADCWPQGADSSDMKTRVLVMVAVKNDVALIASAVGPFRQFGPDFGSGKPSAADLQIALDMGKYVNSFAWRGDPPR